MLRVNIAERKFRPYAQMLKKIKQNISKKMKES